MIYLVGILKDKILLREFCILLLYYTVLFIFNIHSKYLLFSNFIYIFNEFTLKYGDEEIMSGSDGHNIY